MDFLGLIRELFFSTFFVPFSFFVLYYALFLALFLVFFLHFFLALFSSFFSFGCHLESSLATSILLRPYRLAHIAMVPRISSFLSSKMLNSLLELSNSLLYPNYFSPSQSRIAYFSLSLSGKKDSNSRWLRFSLLREILFSHL